MHRSIDDVSPHASCSDTASNAHCHRTSDTVKSRIRPNNGRSKQHSSGSKNIASHANAGNCESGSDGLPAAAAAARQQSIPSVNPTPSVNNKSTILSKNNLPPSALNDKWQTKFQEQYRGSRSRHALPYSTYATMASAIDNPNPSKGRMSESTAAKLNALRPKLLGMAFAPWSILEYMTFTGPPLEYGGNTTSESRSPRDKHARNPSAFPSKSLQSAHPALETHYKLRASDTGSSSLSKSASVPLGKHESSAQLSTVARSSTNPPLRGGDDCSAAMRDSISDRTFSDSLYISTGKLNSDRDSRLTTALATESLNSVEKDKCALLSDSDLKQSIRYKSAPLNVSAMDPVIVINDGYMSSDAIKPDMSFKQVDGAVSTLKSTPLESPRLATAQTTGTASDTNFKPQNKPVARPAYSFGKIKQKTLADSKQSQPQATIINTENQKLECHGSSNASSASMGQSAHNDPKKEFNVLLIKGWEQVHKRLHSVVIKIPINFNTRGTHSFTAASPVKPLTETDWRQLGIHHKRSGDANNLRIKNSSRGSPRYKQARVMQCLHYSASVICFMMTTSIRDEASGTNSYVNACPSKETCVDSLLKAAFGLMRSEDWDPLHSLLLRCHASLITRALNFTQRAYQNQQRDKTRLQRKLDDTTIPNDIARLDTELQKISAQIYANATWYTEMSGFVVSTMKQAGKLCPDFHQMFHAYMLKGPISADSKPVVICETANHILEAFAASRFPDFFFEFFPECLTTMS
ncbi:hypothetical protein BATDEDRAFT_24798 [Batrachochytrium dendrobatidis JAM81]|uniref:Uncharacterized protein n=1 Tax=Batrachochytrium dendrobatidis (strain JAM81 / FGSC 10211) TaxID=684364 RepID=F4P2R3_BATDJ|nr:uncharacterized protein BATDEDRAFT_24798 [Batrachochytrium dendrobatidis JAM81]EGF80064.1 hypothetical protein BATDEDRAFT_24798 [Batrachochytrium dendrobatidis JAM81]|eukprot:XP_006678927.1 hypothetical protein BATDEDRAFT_24798 [Batrachochytrium dendrobatidis JAM81]